MPAAIPAPAASDMRRARTHDTAAAAAAAAPRAPVPKPFARGSSVAGADADAAALPEAEQDLFPPAPAAMPAGFQRLRIDDLTAGAGSPGSAGPARGAAVAAAIAAPALSPLPPELIATRRATSTVRLDDDNDDDDDNDNDNDHDIIESNRGDVGSGDERIDWPKVRSTSVGGDPGQLLGACEPLFQFICQLNRMKRSRVANPRFESHFVRQEFERLFHEMLSSEKSLQLMPLLEPLRCFADIVVTRAGYPFAKQWRPLHRRDELPDAVLLNAVSQALVETPGPGAARLPVLHVCLCFASDLIAAADSPSATELLEQVARRIDLQRPSRICPAAYTGVFTRAILPPVARRLRALAGIGLTVLLIAIGLAVTVNLKYAEQLDLAVKSVQRKLERTVGQHEGGGGGGTKRDTSEASAGAAPAASTVTPSSAPVP